MSEPKIFIVEFGGSWKGEAEDRDDAYKKARAAVEGVPGLVNYRWCLQVNRPTEDDEDSDE